MQSKISHLYGEAAVYFCIKKIKENSNISPRGFAAKDLILSEIFKNNEYGRFAMAQARFVNLFDDDSIRQYPQTALAVATEYFETKGKIRQNYFPQDPAYLLMNEIFTRQSFAKHTAEWKKLIGLLPGLRGYLSDIVAQTQTRDELARTIMKFIKATETKDKMSCAGLFQ